MSDPRLLVPALLLTESLHFVFARLLLPYLPPVASGLYVMALATFQVALFGRRAIQWGVLRTHLAFFLGIGALVAVNTNMGFLAVAYIDPGTAALLTRTSVIFNVALGMIWLGERLTRAEILGGALALAGVMVVSFQPGDYVRLGSLLVVAGSFLYAVHAAMVKRSGGGIPFFEFFLFRLGTTAAFLLVLATAQGDLVGPPGAAAWGILLLTATIDVVVSRALYYLALRRIDISVLTIIQTTGPVVTMAWSFVLLGVLPSTRAVLGGAAILAGVLLVTASRAGRLRRPRAW